MMTGRAKIAGVLLTAALFAAPAMAQGVPSSARIDEMTCVYTGMAALPDDDFFAIADIAMSESAEGEEVERLGDLVVDLGKRCIAKHAWGAAQIDYAVEIGIKGVVADTLATDMIDFGLADTQILVLESLIETMDEANFDSLYYGTWREEVGRAELDKLWLANGIPQIEAILERIPVFMEARIAIIEMMDQWTQEFPEQAS